jgi:hypothetical protein
MHRGMSLLHGCAATRRNPSARAAAAMPPPAAAKKRVIFTGESHVRKYDASGSCRTDYAM